MPTERGAAVDVLRPARSAPVLHIWNENLVGGETKEVRLHDLDGWSAVVVAVRVTYHPEATAGVRVRWLYGPAWDTWDSEEDAEVEGNYADLTFSPGAHRQRTILIPVLSPYVKVQVVNLDTARTHLLVGVWTWLLR